MHIICPHCTTSYAIELSTLGVSGRTVRCSRCREVWLARPQDVMPTPVSIAVMAGGAAPARLPARFGARHDLPRADETPVIESPPLSADLPSHDDILPERTDFAADEAVYAAPARRRRRRMPSFSLPRMAVPRVSLATLCAAMGALAVGLLVWRSDVVRLLPQTAAFYRMVGLDVNLRGLAFKDVKVSSETVDGKPVLVIEG